MENATTNGQAVTEQAPTQVEVPEITPCGTPDGNGDDANGDDANPPCGCWAFPQVSGRCEWLWMFSTAVVALVLCDAATDVCGFVEASVLFCLDDDCGTSTVERRNIGINVYEDVDGECISWRKGTDKDDVYNDDDEMWTVVRFLVGVASVVSLLLVIFLGFAACVSYPRRMWYMAAYLVQCVWFLYSLSFLLFGAEVCQEPDFVRADYDDCTFDTGAGLMLAGVLVWMPASVFVWRVAFEVHKNESTESHVPNDSEEGRPDPGDRRKESQESLQDVPLEESQPDLTPTDAKCGNHQGWSFAWLILVVASIVTNAVVIAVMKK